MSKPFRVGYFGGGVQAAACLERLAATPDIEIVFVHPRDRDDAAVTEVAIARQIAIMPMRSVNDDDALAYVERCRLDLIVSVNAKQIFGAALRAFATEGAINLHNGMLPRQRGGGGAYTGIINGEPLGTTVHFMDDGTDTGDIIVQREIAFSPTATMGAFQQAATDLAPDLIAEAVAMIMAGTVVARPQVGQAFSYTPAKAEWDELIDWYEPAQVIFDKVRARTPGPANFYIYGDEIHEVLKVEMEPLLLPYRNTVGQVLQRHRDKGVLVKTADSGLWICEMRRREEGVTRIPDHPVGTMLRHNLGREIFELKQRISALESALAERG